MKMADKWKYGVEKRDINLPFKRDAPRDLPVPPADFEEKVAKRKCIENACSRAPPPGFGEKVAKRGVKYAPNASSRAPPADFGEELAKRQIRNWPSNGKYGVEKRDLPMPPPDFEEKVAKRHLAILPGFGEEVAERDTETVYKEWKGGAMPNDKRSALVKRSSTEEEILERTNEYRALHGSPALTIDSTITASAAAHCSKLASENSFYHSSTG